MVSESRRDSVGRGRDSVGGVVADFFRGLQKPTRFSGGGGLVGEFFRGLHKFSVNGALLHF